jgi:SNF2 family DNA or RNA helicase
MTDTSKLFPHQLETYKFHKDRDCGADGSDPGTGKTLPHLKIAEHWLENGGSRVLVLSPKILVRSAWLADAQQHAPHLAAHMALAEAPADNRKAAFDSDKEIVLMNVDGLQWLGAENRRWLKNRLGDKSLLLIDESHLLKNPNAKRTKAALDVSQYFAKRHVMSGTMSPNSVTELWSQFKIVDQGVRLGTRFTAFRNAMQMPVQKGPFIDWVDKPDSAEIVNALVSDIMIRHEFAEVMKHVPGMEKHIVWYELPKKHRETYNRLENQSYLEFGDKDISALNAGILAQKLLQCASGGIYFDGTRGEKTYQVIDSGRYELIAELVESRPHSIVFFLWKHQKAELERIFKARKISYEVLDGDVKGDAHRAKIVDDYQTGKYKTLLMHPKTGAYGLTLTKAKSVIYASPIYEASAKLQGDARVLRGMQDQITESIVVLAKDTRDEHAYRVFSGKMDRLVALNNLFAR